MSALQVSRGGRGNKAVMLSPVQLAVLRAAADGAPLRIIAQRTGLPVTQVSARMTQIYKRLGINKVPVGRSPAQRRTRRALALAEARNRGHDI